MNVFLTQQHKFLSQKIYHRAFLFCSFLIVFFGTFLVGDAAILSTKIPSRAVVGERIAVDVLVDPEGKVVNSVEATVRFPSDVVSFNGFSGHQSGISLWVEQPKELSSGAVHFSGVIPGGLDRLYDPLNINNKAIPLVRLFFIVKKAGAADITISHPLVLANDGKGTILITSTRSSEFQVSAQEKNTAVVVAQEDTTPPNPFKISIVDRSLFGRTPRLAVFSADDTTGGVEHYEVAVGGLRFQKAESPFALPYRLFSYGLTVRAFDFAGNIREQQVTVPGERTYGLGVAIGMLLLVVIVWYRFVKRTKKKNSGAIGVLGIALFFMMHTSAFASGSFVLSPSQKEVQLGKSFSVTVLAKSPVQAMNAVSGTLSIGGGVSVTGISTQGGIVDFWTSEPRAVANQIRFEGVVLNPGYQGQSGRLFTITFTTRKEGIATFAFSDGALLANDGLGSNIIDSLPTLTVRITGSPVIDPSLIPPTMASVPPSQTKVVALPVITEYSSTVTDKGVAFLKGKGEPNALTKLSFKDVSLKSLGEQFIVALQTKKKKPTEALVKNDANGLFQYVSSENLVAGVYNVTPFLVDEDTQTQKPGFGVQVLVNNSKMVHWLVVLINILALLIPVACLAVIIYFIPWYSRLRMKILKHKIAVEDEQLTLSEKVIKEKEHHIGDV